MTRVFISYRRADSLGDAGRIKDRLESRFGRGKVFFDISDIKGGAEFEKVIDVSIEQASVLLVVVGQSWHQSFNAPEGQDDPRSGVAGRTDYVRYEIKKGIESGTAIVPILLKGVDRIVADELPADLRHLAQLHALKLHHETFDADMEQIIDAVREIDREAKARRWRLFFEVFKWSWLRERNARSGRHPHVSLADERPGASELQIGLYAVGVRKPHQDRLRVLLRDVTCCVRAGGFLAIGGPDAGARQALLQVLALREPPTDGQLLVGWRDAGSMSLAERDAYRLSAVRYVGRAPESQLQTPRAWQFGFRLGRQTRETVEGVLLQEVRRVKDFDSPRCDARVRFSMKCFGLDPLARARLSELDTRQLQRFYFARAIVTAPSVLVVDAAAIMLGGAAAVLSALQALNEQTGMTMICEADAALPRVSATASLQITLKDGRIERLGVKQGNTWNFALPRAPD